MFSSNQIAIQGGNIMAIESVKSVSQTAYQQQMNVSNANTTTTQVETKQVENISIDADKKEKTQAASNEQIKKAVSELNKKMSDTSCQFGINDVMNRVTIKIIDNKTKEVIKEYPAEETMKMIEKAWELAGIMVDEKL